VRLELGALTTLRFPALGLMPSSPPGPMLLLRDFFLFAANVLPTSTVAFSLPDVFLLGDCPPIDLRDRRVAGSVTSPVGAIVTENHQLLLWW
jgi:hypothetical protein